MARHIYIGGVDRFDDYEGKTLEVQAALSYAIDTCRFSVHGAEPPWGTEVVVEDDDHGRLFAGVCMAPDLDGETPGHEVQTWHVDCDDFTVFLAERLVTEVYENTKAHVIFKDLVTKYATRFGVEGVADDSPVIEYIAFMDVPLPDAFKMLCDYVGFQWLPDYFMQLHFFSLENPPPAPLSLVPGGPFSDLKYKIDVRGMKNRVIVRGGNMLSDPFTARMRGDGISRQWTLPHKPHELLMWVGGDQVQVGIEHIDDEASRPYLMNYQQGYVRASEQTATPAANVPITFVYRFDVPVILQVDDVQSQKAVAAVMGGDGILETTHTDDTIVTLEGAQAAGEALLRKIGNPRTYVEFDTTVMGWQPGQSVTVDLEDRGVAGSFLVQHVTVTAPTSEDWNAHVEAGSTVRGLADLLHDMAEQARRRMPREVPTINKGTTYVEVITVSDVLTLTTGVSGPAEIGTAIVGFSEIGA